MSYFLLTDHLREKLVIRDTLQLQSTPAKDTNPFIPLKFSGGEVSFMGDR